ncbi:MAG: exodeoxyribonuclease VII small subunit [Clostridia bacterium]
MAKEEIGLEKVLVELDDIVVKMENPNTSLNESVVYFERAIKLTEKVTNIIKVQKGKITVLTEQMNKLEERLEDDNR